MGRALWGSVREGEPLRAMWTEDLGRESDLTHMWRLEGSEGQSLKHREGGHVGACGETPNYKRVGCPEWSCEEGAWGVGVGGRRSLGAGLSGELSDP